MNKNQAMSELKKFKELLDINAITQEEYDAKKNELMPFLMDQTNDAIDKSDASSQASKPIVHQKTNRSNMGCMTFCIIASALCFFFTIVGSGSSSSSSSTTSLHEVEVISQSNFEERIKKVLRDPDSYQCIDYNVEHVSGDNYKATLTFRAKNGFGGMNISTYQGDLIWSEGSSSYSLGHIKKIE